MSLFDITVNNSCPEGHADNLKILIQKIDLLMNKFDELQSQVTSLQGDVGNMQTAIDTEQQQVADAIAKLNQTEAQLRDQLANGASPEQLQTLIDTIASVRTGLQTAKDDLASTIADIPSTNTDGTGGDTTSSPAA